MESFQLYHGLRRALAIIDFVKSLPDTFLKCWLTTKCEEHQMNSVEQFSYHQHSHFTDTEVTPPAEWKREYESIIAHIEKLNNV